MDHRYIIAGYTYSFGPGTPTHSNVYLVKTDSLGDAFWTKTYGITENSEEGFCVDQTFDGGYIVIGNIGC
jgi:hypothetical protein